MHRLFQNPQFVDLHSDRVAPQQVSLDYYRRESMKIAARFKEGLSGCELGESQCLIQTTIPLPLLNRR
jgi:hypothetical protein